MADGHLLSPWLVIYLSVNRHQHHPNQVQRWFHDSQPHLHPPCSSSCNGGHYPGDCLREIPSASAPDNILSGHLDFCACHPSTSACSSINMMPAPKTVRFWLVKITTHQEQHQKPSAFHHTRLHARHDKLRPSSCCITSKTDHADSLRLAPSIIYNSPGTSSVHLDHRGMLQTHTHTRLRQRHEMLRKSRATLPDKTYLSCSSRLASSFSKQHGSKSHSKAAPQLLHRTTTARLRRQQIATGPSSATVQHNGRSQDPTVILDGWMLHMQ